MIRNETEYRQTQKALDLMRQAVVAIKREHYPHNKQAFAFQSAEPLEQITKLQAELDVYDGIADAQEAQADLWMRIEGRNIHWPQADTSVLTEFLDRLRKSLQQIAEFAHQGNLSTRPTGEIKDACSLELLALQSGSLRVGVTIPKPDLYAENAEVKRELYQQANTALGEFLKGAAALSNPDESVMETSFPEIEKRRVVLNAIKNLVPRQRGRVSRVEFSGMKVASRTPLSLTKESLGRLDRAILATIVEQAITVEGYLREIDLDELRCQIRDPENTNVWRCEFTEDMLETACQALDHRVQAVGTKQTSSSRSRKTSPIHLISLEIVEPEVQSDT